jgi:hypothetical protein
MGILSEENADFDDDSNDVHCDAADEQPCRWWAHPLLFLSGRRRRLWSFW